MQYLLIISTVVLLLGCGGSGGDAGGTNTVSENLNTGYYLDSAVAGVSYECGSKTGTTDSEGKFYFANSVNCTFSYNGIILRETDAKDLQPNVKVYEDNIYVGRFLQSMDQDGISGNGIQILKEVGEILTLSGKTSVPQTDAEIDDLITQLKAKVPSFTGRTISLVDAKAHIDSTYSLYQEQSKDELELSHDAYLGLLERSINPGSTFGWKTNNETDGLTTNLNNLESKITVAESELQDVDISSANQTKIDALYSNKTKLSTLIQTLKQKNIQLDTAIRVGSSVADVNTLIDEIKALIKGDVYKYFDDLANYGRIPLQTLSINPDNADQMEINRYLNQAGASALSFINGLDKIYARMLLVSNAYTQSRQAQIKQAYDTTTDTNPNSCSVANYTNSVVLEPQLIGQCQMAYFYDCAIKQYGPSYPDKVIDMQNNIKTVCSILDGYKDFTIDGSNPKDSCGYCDGVNSYGTSTPPVAVTNQCNHPTQGGRYNFSVTDKFIGSYRNYDDSQNIRFDADGTGHIDILSSFDSSPVNKEIAAWGEVSFGSTSFIVYITSDKVNDPQNCQIVHYDEYTGDIRLEGIPAATGGYFTQE